MKVLFLDIDGVLNSHAYLYQTTKPWPEKMEFRGNEHLMLDPAAVLRLNTILSMTGAWIVISSSWRFGRTLDQLRTILKARGFLGYVRDTTVVLDRDCRGHEITEWVIRNPKVESLVVLDDDSDSSFVMQNYLVKTSFMDGLQDAHAQEAIRLLKQPLHRGDFLAGYRETKARMLAATLPKSKPGGKP